MARLFIDPEGVEKLQREAEDRGITLSELVRERILEDGERSGWQEPASVSPKPPSRGYGDGLDDARLAGHG